MTVDAAARSPLGERAEALERIGAREVALLAQVSVRANVDTVPGLPREPNTWIATGEREAAWLGPDEWLVLGPPGTSAEIVSTFEALGADAVVDVSANRAVIELAGGHRSSLLEQGCGLDLHPLGWREGMCAQTLLAHVPALLQEREDTTRVFVRPSFAGWLVDWLLIAAE